jgi:hypothetical protein
MRNFRDRTQHTGDLEVKQVENGKVNATIRTILQGIIPLQVYEFLTNLNPVRFEQFHPQDHKKYKVLYRPQKGIVGTIIYLKEAYENGYISSAKVKFIEADPGKKLVLKSISPWWLPITLIFDFESIDNGTQIIHQIIAGSDLPVLRNVYNKIVAMYFLSKGNIEAIYKHIKSEYKNLEGLLQNEYPISGAYG